MSFKKTFFKSISDFAIYSYLTQGIEFFSTIILSRLLLPSEYGFFAIILIPAGFANLFANLGIRESILRTDYGETFYRHLNSIAFILGIILSAFLMALAWPMALFFNNKALILPTILLSLKFVLDSFSYVPYAILAKKLQFGIIGKIRLYATGSQILLTILLAFAGISYWALVIPMIISPVIQYGLIRNKVNVKFRLYSLRASKRIFKKIRSLVGILYLNNFIEYWAGNTDKVIIGKLFTEADLGLYNRAFKFIGLTNRLITRIFSTVLFPTLKKLLEEKGNVTKEYLDILRIITCFNLPVVFVLTILPDTLVYYLWGPEWMEVAVYLPYVGLILIYNSIFSTMGPVFILYNKEKLLLLFTVLNTMISILMVIIGAFFSILHILIFLSLGHIVFLMPIALYLGLFKSFGFKTAKIMQFAAPVISFSGLLFFSVYKGLFFLIIVVFIVYTFFLLFELRSSFFGSIAYLKRKLFSKV